jgi:hypothetical protein
LSFTDSYTEYNFNIDLAGQPENASFTLLSQVGMTDVLALDVLAALNGIAWPAGTTVTLGRRDKTEVDYTTDLTTTPPTFT